MGNIYMYTDISIRGGTHEEDELFLKPRKVLKKYCSDECFKD